MDESKSDVKDEIIPCGIRSDHRLYAYNDANGITRWMAHGEQTGRGNNDASGGDGDDVSTGTVPPQPVDWGREWQVLLAALVYAIFGILLLMAGYLVFDLLTPTNMQKKIFEEGNIAVAIVVGFFLLGLAVVIHGAFTI